MQKCLNEYIKMNTLNSQYMKLFWIITSYALILTLIINVVNGIHEKKYQTEKLFIASKLW